MSFFTRPVLKIHFKIIEMVPLLITIKYYCNATAIKHKHYKLNVYVSTL